MKPKEHKLKSGRTLIIREAKVEESAEIIEYVKSISAESDYLTFGEGEFEITEPEEMEFIQKCLESDNQLFLVGLINDEIVGTLTFAGGQRPRVRHCGEFGMTVQKKCWGLGIGSLMLDALIEWARDTQVVKKINLRVRTDNHRAVNLYTHKGFSIEGTIRKEMYLDGHYFDHYWMGLEL